MNRPLWLAGVLLPVLWIAVPALSAEPGITETSSMTPSDDLTHADFARTVTNGTDEAIDIAPRDLGIDAYPILTVSMLTVGSFEGDIWTIGTLAAGETATIVYSGDVPPSAAAPAAAPAAATAAPPAAVAARSQPATEELPFTGLGDHLAILAVAGIALIGGGASLLRLARG